jgi:hypothetical protein
MELMDFLFHSRLASPAPGHWRVSHNSTIDSMQLERNMEHAVEQLNAACEALADPGVLMSVVSPERLRDKVFRNAESGVESLLGPGWRAADDFALAYTSFVIAEMRGDRAKAEAYLDVAREVAVPAQLALIASRELQSRGRS